jgi:hypothetical protein
MSEQDNQGVQNNTTSPVEQNMVPKERIDELIAQRNMIAQQNQVLQDLLRKAVPGQQQVPVQEPEDMVRLREENPALYQRIKQQEHDNQRMKATAFKLMEDNDRRALVDEFGDEGKKYLHKVEEKLAELRSKGIHNYDRGQIFYHLKGQEAVEKLRAPKPQSNNVPLKNDFVDPPQVSNVPSSNPVSASTSVSGSAAVGSRTETLEELEARLADVVL